MNSRRSKQPSSQNQFEPGPKTERFALSCTSIAVGLLFAFLCGCSKPNDQGGAVTHHDEATPADTVTNSESVSPPTDKLQLSGSADAGITSNAPLGSALGLSSGHPSTDAFSARKATKETIVEVQQGTVYEGDVLDGKPNGQGTLSDQNGRNQYGEWRDGKEYRVSGTVVFSDGTKEVGTWNNDGSKSGGTIMWKDGRQYKGDWRIMENATELPDGQGEMTWPDGRKYVGQFYNGKMDGTGKMTYPTGKTETGLWKQDQFVGPTQ